LLDSLAGYANERGYRVVQLWTGHDNHRARQLYRRAGFASSGRTNRLSTGQLVVHFTRTIGPSS
jgi:ribosomal protein S18 acetylase RimI-like enzyme